MSKNKKQKHSQIAIDTIDKLDMVQSDIRFMSNILIAWDVSLSSPNANDLTAMSRMCNTMDKQLSECRELVDMLV